MVDFFYSIFGYIILFIRYPKKEKRLQILKDYFDGSYHETGSQMILSIFGIVLLVLLILFLVAVIYSIICT